MPLSDRGEVGGTSDCYANPESILWVRAAPLCRALVSWFSPSVAQDQERVGKCLSQSPDGNDQGLGMVHICCKRTLVE